jgi:hypothetical protein
MSKLTTDIINALEGMQQAAYSGKDCARNESKREKLDGGELEEIL